MIYVIVKEWYDYSDVIGYTDTEDKAKKLIDNYLVPYKEKRDAAVIHNELIYKEWIDNNEKAAYELWFKSPINSGFVCSKTPYYHYFNKKSYLDKINIKIEGLKDMTSFGLPSVYYTSAELIDKIEEYPIAKMKFEYEE